MFILLSRDFPAQSCDDKHEQKLLWKIKEKHLEVTARRPHLKPKSLCNEQSVHYFNNTKSASHGPNEKNR